MKGLLLFVAGLLCGGAAIAWLFLGDPPVPAPVSSVEARLPAPAVVVDSATGLEPGGDDLATAIARTNGGALNPTWVEWLMGFPLGWTDCAPSATP